MTAALIIDNGTGMIKAGLSSEESPSLEFPCVVGVNNLDKAGQSTLKSYYVGWEALKKKGVLQLHWPMENGNIKEDEWDNMKRIWEHIYEELGIDKDKHPVHFTEAPRMNQADRQKIGEIFIEEWGVPSYWVSVQAVLVPQGAGHITGLVLDSGDGVTHAVPVYENLCLKWATQRINLAGRHLTDAMYQWAPECNIQLEGINGMEYARQMKEQSCYVSQNFDAELAAWTKEKNKPYQLPDGRDVAVGNLQIRVPEVLFNPMMIGNQGNSVPKCVVECVQRTDIELRREFYNNIFISGGTTCFEGFAERLETEVNTLTNPNIKPKVYAQDGRKHLVWCGAHAMTNTTLMNSKWVGQEEWSDYKIQAVDMKN